MDCFGRLGAVPPLNGEVPPKKFPDILLFIEFTLLGLNQMP